MDRIAIFLQSKGGIVVTVLVALVKRPFRRE